MDHTYTNAYGSANGSSSDTYIEEYGRILSELQQAKDGHTSLPFHPFGHQHLTPDSTVEESTEQQHDQLVQDPEQMAPMNLMHQYNSTSRSQWQAVASDLTPESQNDGSFSPQSQGSSNATRANASQGVAFTHAQSWPDLDGVGIFSNTMEQAVGFQVPHDAFTGSLDVNGHVSMAGQMLGMSELASLNDQNGPHTGQNHTGITMDSRSRQMSIAQPMAVHGGAHQSSHANYLNAQAEQMGSKPSTASQTNRSDGRLFSTASSTMESLCSSQSNSGLIKSRSVSEDSSETFPEVFIPQTSTEDADTARRTSATTDITHDITQFHLQNKSPELPMHIQPVFKKPSLPQGATLAERRRQQLPLGLNVQRPKPLNLNRAFSSSAVGAAPSAGRFPVSPHATLRRNKSSNVLVASGGVLSGRIQKTGTGSTRNSPLVGSFPEETTETPHAHTQATCSTPTSAAISTQPMPAHMMESMADVSAEGAIPLSADPSICSPALRSGGSIMGGAQSWMDTPITTPYGPSTQTISVNAHWAPASNLPQSAPAHVLSFPRDISPPTMPSMPLTPAHTHYTNSQASMHGMMQGSMNPHMFPVVPSQHGLSENPSFISQQARLMQLQQPNSWASHAPWLSVGPDPYGEHALWLMQNTVMPQKEIEVKLDAGCQKLRDEVSKGEAKLVRLRNQEFTFQNTTTRDMRKVLEDKE